MYGLTGIAVAALACLVSAVPTPGVAEASPMAATSVDSPSPPGIAQVIWDQCREELAVNKVTVTKPYGNNNGIRLDDIPNACMTVMGIMVGGGGGAGQSGGTTPQIVGPGDLLYDNLPADEFMRLSKMFDGWAAGQLEMMRKRSLSTE